MRLINWLRTKVRPSNWSSKHLLALSTEGISSICKLSTAYLYSVNFRRACELASLAMRNPSVSLLRFLRQGKIQKFRNCEIYCAECNPPHPGPNQMKNSTLKTVGQFSKIHFTRYHSHGLLLFFSQPQTWDRNFECAWLTLKDWKKQVWTAAEFLG